MREMRMVAEGGRRMSCLDCLRRDIVIWCWRMWLRILEAVRINDGLLSVFVVSEWLIIENVDVAAGRASIIAFGTPGGR